MSLDVLVSDCLGPPLVSDSDSSSVATGKLLFPAGPFSLATQRYLGALHRSASKAWK